MELEINLVMGVDSKECTSVMVKVLKRFTLSFQPIFAMVQMLDSVVVLSQVHLHRLLL